MFRNPLETQSTGQYHGLSASTWSELTNTTSKFIENILFPWMKPLNRGFSPEQYFYEGCQCHSVCSFPTRKKLLIFLILLSCSLFPWALIWSRTDGKAYKGRQEGAQQVSWGAGCLLLGTRGSWSTERNRHCERGILTFPNFDPVHSTCWSLWSFSCLSQA